MAKLRLDKTQKRLWYDGKEIILSGPALAAFICYADRQGAPVKRTELEQAVWRRRMSPSRVPQINREINDHIGINVVALVKRGRGWHLTEAVDIVDYEPSPPHCDSVEFTELAEKTYFAYRDVNVPQLDSPEVIDFLEARYSCYSIHLGHKRFPATVIWQNTDGIIFPDTILGEFDCQDLTQLTSISTLNEAEYAKARAFIEAEYTKGPIKQEGLNYCMTAIDTTQDIPKVHGKFGRYYDNILSQYAMEWELKKALLNHRNAPTSLSHPGTLPLREAVEKQSRNPLIDGNGRRAAITLSNLTVFRRRHRLQDERLLCLLRRRSMDVGVSPGMLHVVPAGMFEAFVSAR